MYIYVCVYTYIYIYIYINTHTHTYTQGFAEIGDHILDSCSANQNKERTSYENVY